MHAYNPNIWEAEAELLEFKASMAYKMKHCKNKTNPTTQTNHLKFNIPAPSHEHQQHRTNYTYTLASF